MRLPAYQQLSKEQDEINNLPLDGSYLVVGPPGTGKSVMALYRAQLYKRLGRPVRLIVHSRLLSQYTERATDELEIDAVVQTFHSWWTGFYRSVYKRPPPQTEPYVFDWQTILVEVAEDPPQADSIPYLIIDEGQDLPKEFYVVARHLAENMTVFADDNQIVTTNNATIEEIRRYGRFGSSTHELTRNYRNTKQVAALASHFQQHENLTGAALPPTRSGPTPVAFTHQTLNEAVQQIARFERANSDLEVGVFVPTRRLQTQFLNRLEGKTSNPVQAYIGGKGRNAAQVDFAAPGIKVICFPSVKGLEFDAVFIPQLQSTTGTGPSIEMTLYVLFSRARTHLFLAHEGDRTSAVMDLLPRELVEWT